MRSSMPTSAQGASCSQRCMQPALPHPLHRRARGQPLHASIPNEATTLYKGIPLATGLINRRLMEKQMAKENKEFVSAMKMADDEVRKEELLRREMRTPAANDEELVEYFLNTVAEDMEYEVARNRPKLTPDFFKFLDKAIGQERFSMSGQPNEERLLELEALRQYLASAVEVLEQTVAKTSSAKERVAKLLSSRDKKATILEMAENNEIDQGLMDLLQQNIDMARMASQDDAVRFMEKVMQACAKFYVPPAPPASALPALPAGASAAAAGPASPSSPAPMSLPEQLQAASAGGAPAPPPSLILPGSVAPRQSNMGVPVAARPAGASSLIIPGR